ncbi:lysophospholipid acyltransferase family protein [Nakamurella leprariae]|uniref:lysophospholipid acyltransferase family protein n=1 Tax=Nakamurella leprariae TaxID=2803911 RepID=UPI002E28ED66|nr:lysophospholipid acyltransferase family protein [Nakamurella leprariae]
MLYALCKYVLIGPLLRVSFPATVIGAEYVPETGGAILAGNHVSVADSFFTPLYLKRRVSYLAKSEYFTERGLKGRIKKFFFTGIGQVPVDRSGASAARAALDTGIRLLRDGELLGIYPEGTRSPDGRLYKGKTGVARMALEAGVPVVPIVMLGTDKVNPIGSKVWRPHKITMIVGRPLDFSRYEGMAGDRFVERSMTDEIMYRLMEMSGQEYVDVYAAKAKEEIANGTRPRSAPRQLPAARPSALRRLAQRLRLSRRPELRPLPAEGRGPGTVTRLPRSKAG